MESAIAQVHSAVRDDDVELLKKLLREEERYGAALIDGRDYDKRTPLHVAASHNSVTAAQLLLSAGAKRNSLDRWRRTPLAVARERRMKPMVKLLQRYGAEVVGPPRSSDWMIRDGSEICFENSVLIGEGTFGEVWQASWRGTTVAVKTIKPDMCRSRGVVKDFLNEVELLVNLRHPNIVQFLAASVTHPPFMLITEYLSGGDLHELIRKGPLPANLATSFALDMARGMAYLHSGRNVVIHRDLKPQNLIIDDTNSHLKVGDFGLSKLVPQATTNVHEVYEMTGQTGSYRYMAPEVFLRKSYNSKVDVFSFGMILYEMFEGKAPFHDEDDKEAAFMMAKEDRRPEFGSKTFYPKGMRELIIKCWSEFAVKRPPFHEIVLILENVQRNLDAENHRRHCLWHLLRCLRCRCQRGSISEYQGCS